MRSPYDSFPKKENFPKLPEVRRLQNLELILMTKVHFLSSSALPDLVLDTDLLRAQMEMTAIPLLYLRCAMEENCLAKSAAIQIR